MKISATRSVTMCLLGVLCLVSLLLILVHSPASQAANLTVTSTADSGPGTLRQAILDAVSGDTITFALPANSVIQVSGAQLDISNKVLTISGPGANELNVRRSGVGRVFRISSNSNVTISGVTVSKGLATGQHGGGVFNEGTLVLTNCSVTDNSVDASVFSADGGGIYNAGTMTISNCLISGNSASLNASGGGINNNGGMTIINSTVSGNSAETFGGGIRNTGTLKITTSTISGNAVGGTGGGIFNSNTLTIAGSSILNNTAGNGGAIFSSGSLMISTSVISDNSAPAGEGGGIYNTGGMTITDTTVRLNSIFGAGRGGGIFSSGTLDLTASTISGNITAGGGGGIFNGGTLSIYTSTISNNQAGGNGSGGGGIYNAAALTSTFNTFSGNSALTTGGAIFNDQTGNLTLIATTISGNSTTDNSSAGSSVGGAFYTRGVTSVSSCTITANTSSVGGAIYVSPSLNPSVTVRSSIIAKNVAVFSAPDASGGTLTSLGYNLIGNNSGATIASSTGDQIGTTAAPIDPLLGPLQNNGGPTFTRALLTSSTAIDRGISPSVEGDQRGLLRPVDSPTIANASGGDGSDIGAYEVQADALQGCGTFSLTVTNNNDNGAGSLRNVLLNACGGETITFAPNVTGAIALTSGELPINRALTINGPGAGVLTVRRSAAAADFRIFQVATTLRVNISGLTIANGVAPSTGGGGILNFGRLSISNCTLTGNSANSGGGGGAILNYYDVTLTDSTVSLNVATDGGGVRNAQLVGGGGTPTNATFVIGRSVVANNTSTSGSGGGIQNDGELSVGNSTISGNTANSNGGGGFSNRGTSEIFQSSITANSANSGPGGGILNAGTLAIIKSTIANNAANAGGGLHNSGRALTPPQVFFGQVTITDSTVSGNTATNSGGGVHNFNFCTIAVTNTTIAGNTAGAIGGGGIFNGLNGTFTSRNTITALNTAPTSPDIGGTITSQGFNLIGNRKDAVINNVQSSDQLGTDASPVDPLIGPLQDNGGPTQSRALLFGSPAIDTGQSSGSSTDQRGLSRPVDLPNPNFNGGDGSDIGAYEAQSGPRPDAVSFTQSLADGESFSITKCVTITITKSLGLSNTNAECRPIQFIELRHPGRLHHRHNHSESNW